jgi:hypothetical protein
MCRRRSRSADRGLHGSRPFGTFVTAGANFVATGGVMKRNTPFDRIALLCRTLRIRAIFPFLTSASADGTAIA